MKRILVLLAAMALLISGQPAAALYYPNTGSFYYGGNSYADSYFVWSSPGPWSHGDVGYEHDLAFNSSFSNVCSSWTNLPYGYDDCVTMGYSEEGLWSASFGSYHINNVSANYGYIGTWSLQYVTCQGCIYPPQGSTPANLQGQEVEHRACWWDNPWCMLSIRDDPLGGGFTLSVGTTTYHTW